ncbi:MAG: hypothetical protein U9R08_02860 [Nanoarchaeota archaeon]|nr:hypothetical protein [Nanoarchaeota archaeon]
MYSETKISASKLNYISKTLTTEEKEELKDNDNIRKVVNGKLVIEKPKEEKQILKDDIEQVQDAHLKKILKKLNK